MIPQANLLLNEPPASHVEGLLAQAQQLSADEATCLAATLFVSFPDARGLLQIEAEHGPSIKALVVGVMQVQSLRDLSRAARRDASGAQTEAMRGLLLALATDVRVVLISLMSRIQTFRFAARQKLEVSKELAVETLEIFCPLANRLGLWQLKWELEDFGFRFSAPEVYSSLARKLEAKRSERQALIERAVEQLNGALLQARIKAHVYGRPKHLFSIHSKMKAKGVAFDDLQDLHALRVVVKDIKACYAALSTVNELWSALTPIEAHFDDYIAKPKANGYQSLHSVVEDSSGHILEVQIRTEAMHNAAEYGVAAHWRYKEKDVRGAGALPSSEWLRQLLAWTADVGTSNPQVEPTEKAVESSTRIYVLTPQSRLIELPEGSTPIDFAYHVHTDLGHRCRGAKVDGQMVPLNTRLKNAQTVEIIPARGDAVIGPSRDWLNPELGYSTGMRTRAKVRQWFNAVDLSRSISAGRVVVERIMAREGKASFSLEALASKLGFIDPSALFAAAAKDEIRARSIEDALHENAHGLVGENGKKESAKKDSGNDAAQDFGQAAAQESLQLNKLSQPSTVSLNSDVLVVGVDFLLTQLARCCRPVPPDAIQGYVTRGKGVSIHRAHCKSLAALMLRDPERGIATTWGSGSSGLGAGPTSQRYPVDVRITAVDRTALLRDISEIFARDKLSVTAVKTVSRKMQAQMQFTVEVPDMVALNSALAAIRMVKGVLLAVRYQI
jgi:GTP pyrophosphokinase